ncbi:SulP family inorganic anion transporter [Maridesulfovibrio salexigens]|uniref:Sulfate transporter n=1 Tax=Maridesulfovibrio salexigens (strain ATCC 14822 / DSM 2638 / NCIMB 8403 / VKM B-1763) TaxID=526222 RepID=C6BW36_MARSD|nr:SulP family inorganic anion transporter [Maridesulfovibrio salexigens]ACS80239.1 sulfate transporter [Maridesulfovibrio salexigens DSM 2638]
MDTYVCSKLNRFIPTSFKFIKSGCSPTTLRQDIAAGVTVGIVALPLAMAFAIASGASPATGLFTAIIAGFIISAFGGTRFQIGGPTGAFVIIISGIIARHGYEGLILATIMAGIILLVMGCLGLGKLLQYIPYPVTTGFTSGIGILIFSTQIKDFLGLQIDQMPADFLPRLKACAVSLPSTDPTTLGLGMLTVVSMLLVRKFIPRIPAPFVGIALASLITWLMGLQTETIGSRFGGIPTILPDAVSFSGLDLMQLKTLIPEAFTIAILAGIESLLSATVADGMSGDRHNSSNELIAQGLANIGSALFGGLPATGAIARTATNIRAGAHSPVAGIIHALTLIMFIKVCAPLASMIPLASLAGVLMLVAWDMSEVHRIKRLLFAPKSDSLVMLIALLLTVFVDLTVAVEVGVVMAAMLFMKRMSQLTDVHSLDTGLPEEEIIDRKNGHEKVVVYEINGPMFFGMAQRFVDVMSFTRKKPEVIVFCMRLVPTMDATGIEALETVIRRAHAQNVKILLSGVNPRIRKTMARLGTDKLVGADNIFPDFSTAVAKTILHVDKNSGLPRCTPPKQFTATTA